MKGEQFPVETGPKEQFGIPQEYIDRVFLVEDDHEAALEILRRFAIYQGWPRKGTVTFDGWMDEIPAFDEAYRQRADFIDVSVNKFPVTDEKSKVTMSLFAKNRTSPLRLKDRVYWNSDISLEASSAAVKEMAILMRLEKGTGLGDALVLKSYKAQDKRVEKAKEMLPVVQAFCQEHEDATLHQNQLGPLASFLFEGYEWDIRPDETVRLLTIGSEKEWKIARYNPRGEIVNVITIPKSE